MKNLMMWVHPSRGFNQETKILIKIQIDNSRELGWKDENILLFTNFKYEYEGIKSRVLDDDAFCDFRPSSSKISTLLKLFEQGLIKKNEIYWMHDLDCYQLIPFKRSEIKLGSKDIALCDYGRVRRWSGGSIFFKKSAQDIFEKQMKAMAKYHFDDETALDRLTYHHPKIRARVKKLDSSYHFLPFNVKYNYALSLKPLRVAHFHPYRVEKRIWLMRPGETLFEWYCGNNRIKTKLIPDRLIKIFNKHGIK